MLGAYKVNLFNVCNGQLILSSSLNILALLCFLKRQSNYFAVLALCHYLTLEMVNLSNRLKVVKLVLIYNI